MSNENADIQHFQTPCMKKKVYEMAKFNKCIAQIGALLVFLGAEA
jgi:hypothetical protein